MKNLFFILTFICATALVSCGGDTDENAGDISIEAVDSTKTSDCDRSNCDHTDCDKKNCDKAGCEKKCDKNCVPSPDCDKSCEKKNCDKFGCEEAGACTPECIADCLANCENPDKCTKMCDKDSTEAACDGAE